jgi:hypothetical protein
MNVVYADVVMTGRRWIEPSGRSGNTIYWRCGSRGIEVTAYSLWIRVWRKIEGKSKYAFTGSATKDKAGPDIADLWDWMTEK